MNMIRNESVVVTFRQLPLAVKNNFNLILKYTPDMVWKIWKIYNIIFSKLQKKFLWLATYFVPGSNEWFQLKLGNRHSDQSTLSASNRIQQLTFLIKVCITFCKVRQGDIFTKPD